MPRDFIPTEYHRLDATPGTIWIAPTSATHIYVCTSSDRERSVWTINGVALRIDAHLYRWTDGSWHVGAEGRSGYDHYHSLSLSRPDFKGDASTAARQKVEAMLPPMIAAWAEDHPDLLAAAAHADRNNRARSVESDIERLAAELAAARERLAAIAAEA